jgi:acetyl esterase/lipase
MTRLEAEGVHAGKKSARTPVLIVVMGVSAAGKSSVAAALAQRLDLPWIDADDLHPVENTAKMASGESSCQHSRHRQLTPQTDHRTPPLSDQLHTPIGHLAGFPAVVVSA